ncbi:MAG: ATPase domain-containing protein [Wolinella sp.]
MDTTINIEGLLLSSLLEYPEGFDEFARYIKPEHFRTPYAEVYKELIKMRNELLPLELSNLSLRLKDESARGILLFISSINPTPNFMDYVPEFERAFKLRRQRELASMFLERADRDEVVEVDDILSLIKEAPHSFKNFKEWASTVESMPVLPKYKLGVSFLDYALGGGIEMAQLVLLSGEPEAGKTSLGTQILENVSQGYKCAFFCFEFTARQYITSKLENNPSFKENENLYIINSGYNISEVAENIRALHKMGVKFFLIDSQMRIEVSKARSLEEEESEKFSTLAKLAHSLEVVILLIVQTSKNDPNNPMGSKKGGHESSITIRIEHAKPEESNEEYHSKKRMVIIKKNKQTGKHFKEEVAFDPKYRTFKRVYESKKEAEVIKDGGGYETKEGKIMFKNAPVKEKEITKIEGVQI